jgi:hypothetical protein
MTFKLKVKFDNEQRDMQTSNANQNFQPDDPVWVPLAEFSLRDLLSDQDWRDGRTAGLLFQMMQELGMSPESIEKIVRTSAGFAKEASARGEQGMLEVPGRIRIFCQKKMIVNADAAKLSKPYHAKQGKEQKRIFPDSGANTIGGWGYFMIERGNDLLSDSSAIPHNSIELYLYKEGELYG